MGYLEVEVYPRDGDKLFETWRGFESIRIDTIDQHMGGEEIDEGQAKQLEKYKSFLSEAWEYHVGRNTHSWQENFYLLNKTQGGAMDELKKDIAGRDVVELGPADQVQVDFAQENGAKSYTGVEMAVADRSKAMLKYMDDEGEITIDHKVVETDGLSHLKKMPDGSAIVISQGVMCPELADWKTHATDYLRLLAKEIYRVTPEGCHTLAIGSSQRELLEAGFEKVDSAGYILKK